MDNIINASIQVLPTSNDKHPYEIVDVAISVIENSGLKYKVCPFETVLEGTYDEVMLTIKKVYESCLQENIESIFSYIKIQIRKNNDVTIEDKMNKYE